MLANATFVYMETAVWIKFYVTEFAMLVEHGLGASKHC